MNTNRSRRIKLRRANQFHRGSKLERRYPGIEIYVHSKRNGKAIRDIEKTVDQLVIVLNRIQKRVKNRSSIMIVGTSPVLGQLLERVFDPSVKKENQGKRILVTRAWVSGIRTNFTNFQNYLMQEKATAQVPSDSKEMKKGKSLDRFTRSSEKSDWYNLHRKERENLVIETTDQQDIVRKKERPGLILFRNPNDHSVGRKEARRCGIPTVGVVDTDCKYSDRLTYPIPGNDDSRMGQLVRIRRVKKARMSEGHASI